MRCILQLWYTLKMFLAPVWLSQLRNQVVIGTQSNHMSVEVTLSIYTVITELASTPNT